MKKLILLASFTIAFYFCTTSYSFAQEHDVDDNTLLLLHFNDNNLDGQQSESPTIATDVSFEPGVFSSGAYLSDHNQFFFLSENNILPSVGTVEFWIKPKWNGNDGQDHYLLRFGGWGGILLGKDGGNYWRIIINRWSPAGFNEVGTGLYISDEWIADKWHHVAFTWDSENIEVFIDGSLRAETTINVPLSPIDEASFQLGGDGSGGFSDAVIDELRISDIVRTPTEILESFNKGVSVDNLTILPETKDLLLTWNFTPQASAQTNLGEIEIPASSISWTSQNSGIASVDENGKITAVSSGSTEITGTFGEKSDIITINVTAPVIDPEEEEIAASLSTSAENYLWEMPVVIIQFLPTTDGINIDADIAEWNSTILELKDRISIFNKRTKFMLEEGSRFRGYKNPSAPPSLGYRVVKIISVYEEMPPSEHSAGCTPPCYEPDYNQILNRFDAEYLVNTLGVKEFWIWGYHHGNIVPVESNMSSPTTGDISNSYRYQDDLPIFDHTYTLYNYNFTRSQAEAVHDHGHQLESILKYAAARQDGNYNLFVRNFSGWGENYSTPPIGRAGDCHHPPNTTSDYDYENMTLISSDIEDWTPDNSGNKFEVNADTWGDINYNWPADVADDIPQKTESQWYIYWMQNMPGYQNSIPYGSSTMTNWWELTGNWDASAGINLGLHNSIDCSNPSSGGVIAADQSGNSPFQPDQLTNEEPPSGHSGILEYKWQKSTTSNSEGFSDISNSNLATYDPDLLTQTTWYKRLTRVDCKSDWAGAAESNVVEITVEPLVLGEVFYVDETKTSGLNNGESWENALLSLQDALSLAEEGKQIWVAAGTYKPTGGTDRTISFQMKNGVAIYGGFAGTESSIDQRDWVSNMTILSGDLGTPEVVSDNSWHVIKNSGLNNTAILDGFTIQKGYADISSNDNGAGMLNYSSSPILNNCTFSDNLALWMGGGIGNFSSSSPKLTNCTIEVNWASRGGGGIFNEASSSPLLTDCTISYNTSNDYGGGMFNASSSPTLINCTVSHNIAASIAGGGIYYENSAPQLINCIISNNTAFDAGGGIFGAGDPGVSAMLYNCLIAGNSALKGGGYFSVNSPQELTNCTISNNSVSETGGGIYNEGGQTVINNSIIWDNSANTGNQFCVNEGSVTLNYSCYSNATLIPTYNGGIFDDTNNNITNNPQFLNVIADDFRLAAASPCLDLGNDSYNQEPNDIRGAGFGRKLLKTNASQIGTIDMGAYEYIYGTDPIDLCNWTGATNSDWNTAGNWNPTTVPSSGSIIIIPDVTNDPVVSNLTISTDGLLTINPGGALTVSGTLTNNGSLTIQANASITGSLIASSSSGTGTTNSQLYMTANKWHLVSPTAEGGSISSFIQNISNAIPSKNVSGTMNYGMIDYNETSNNWNSYFTATTVDNLASGKGYSLRRSSDGVVTFGGSLTSGTKTVNLTKVGAEGWNCVGNPYPSAINMNDLANFSNNFLATNSASLDPSYACMYVWDDGAARYKILGNVDFGIRDLGQNVFQSGQGFFLKALNGSSSVQFTTAMQAHQPDMQLKSGNTSWPGFELTATTGQVKASTVIVFNSKMTKGLDPTYDAGLFRGSSGLNLYTRLINDNGIDFAIQCLTDYDYSSMIIPVGIDSKTGGDVVFSVQTTNLSPDCNVILEDKANKTFTDLSINDYKTSIAPSSSISNRFFIHTSNQTTGIIDGTLADKLSAYAIRNTEIRVKGNVSKLAVATLYNIQGKAILIKNLEEGRLNIIQTPYLKTGIYMLFVKDNNKVQAFKLPMTQ